jgi:group I intron endonuclease
MWRRRLIIYYNLEHLAKYPTRYINNALLKYGYSAFSLYILEYCNEEDLIKREQYYFDLLEPNYNICTVAGSTLGRLHRAESKEKISKAKIRTKPLFLILFYFLYFIYFIS